MPRVNIANPEFEYDEEDPDGFKAGLARYGSALGAQASGTSVYEIPPGQSNCPYHYEAGEEEWLLVLQGNPTLRTPTGSERLDPMDLVCFPAGPEGAHGIKNETQETVRVLMYGTVVSPAVTHYPDSNKVGIWIQGGGDSENYLRSETVDYYDGEA